MGAGPTGIEPATPGLKVRCSSLAELRALLGRLVLIGETRKRFFSVSIRHLSNRLKRDCRVSTETKRYRLFYA
jgi:hypothetical protein